MPDIPVVARYKKAIAREDPKKRQLQPWEMAFAEWYANTPVRPKLVEQYDQADLMAPEGFNPGKSYIETLKRSTAWSEYIIAIKEDNLELARKKLTGNFSSAVDAHFEGLEKARDAEDYKAIPAFTNPILDRVMPKTDKNAQAVTAVTINLGSVGRQLIDQEPIDVECTVLDNGIDTNND